MRAILLGVGGLAIAAALSWSAFAIAGGNISEPARPVSVPSGGEGTSTHGPATSPTKTPPPKTSDDPSDSSTTVPAAGLDDSYLDHSSASPSGHEGDD